MLETNLKTKWERMKAGQEVVVSLNELDRLSDHFEPEDSTDANLFFNRCASKPNPKQVGTLDVLVAWIKPNGG